MKRINTETELWDWRFGQTQAERLCADLLQIEGFIDIDPQCPLGGPDDRKDILCKKGGIKWIAAVYFPPTRQASSDVKGKFLHDFEGAERNHCSGIVFLTNQRLTPKDREDWERLVGGTKLEIYHQERLRSILDSPKGYGLRLEYLRISMTEEEQHSLWDTFKDEITSKLAKQEAHLADISRKMDEFLARTVASFSEKKTIPSSLKSQVPTSGFHFNTADLEIGDIKWIHRILCLSNEPECSRPGRIRDIQVWIMEPGTSPQSARFTPPSPDKVLDLLETLTANWRRSYESVRSGSDTEKILALATFHHGLLSIHPFEDGNGRVARALLQQQALELIGRSLSTGFGRAPIKYSNSLFAADHGDIEQLCRFIEGNLENSH